MDYDRDVDDNEDGEEDFGGCEPAEICDSSEDMVSGNEEEGLSFFWFF